MYFTYVQDDFKVNERLTLNLGERDNHLANLDPIHNQMLFATSGSLYDRALVSCPPG